MNPTTDLSVVIPVRDAADSIEALTTSFCDVEGLDIQVVLVDDCSQDTSPAIVRRLADERPQVEAIVHDVGRGAGIARNEGFERARGRYTLFFDADDVVHVDALTHAVALLDSSGADVAMMPYEFQRGGTAGLGPMHPPDVEVWNSSIGVATHRVTRLREVPDLLGFTNYPWNKILRTETYRRAGLRFGATPVHNDILGHWGALLFAETVLLVNEVICTHVVPSTGRNLTNRRSRVRLHLFDALDETYDLLESMPAARDAYFAQYWAFAVRTSTWAGDRIGLEHRSEFDRRRREHLLRIDLADFARLRMGADPRLADTLVRKALG